MRKEEQSGLRGGLDRNAPDCAFVRKRTEFAQKSE
jgi:hypothetical protein